MEVHGMCEKYKKFDGVQRYHENDEEDSREINVLYLRTNCFILRVVGDSSNKFFGGERNSDLIPTML